MADETFVEFGGQRRHGDHPNTQRRQVQLVATQEPGSRRLKRFVSSAQCTLSCTGLIYAAAYRVVTAVFPYVQVLSDLALASVIIAMLVTLGAALLGYHVAAPSLQFHHPTSGRLIQLMILSVGGFVNITNAVASGAALWLSTRDVFREIPVQAVITPHYIFLMALSMICATVNLRFMYWCTKQICSKFGEEKKTTVENKF